MCGMAIPAASPRMPELGTARVMFGFPTTTVTSDIRDRDSHGGYSDGHCNDVELA